jgi:predicted N-acetyltransferase YhbS
MCVKMSLNVRSLLKEDLKDADHVFRLAFGTFLGMPDPMKFAGDADYLRTRWLTDPSAAFVAELDGRVVGSNFAARWGTFGFFGPLTVHPDFWDRGIAKRLLNPTMELFSKWGVTHTALFTFAQSPKHFGLYRTFGFWPRCLTLIMSKQVQKGVAATESSNFSDVSEGGKDHTIAKCRELTASIYKGLDLEREIMAVQKQKLGETVLLWNGNSLVGLAVCHCGPGTEAGGDVCYIKFGAIRNDPDAYNAFDKLLDACEGLAASKGMASILAGVNTACYAACNKMIGRGYRPDFQGVMMLRPSEPALDTPDRYVICDLR